MIIQQQIPWILAFASALISFSCVIMFVITPTKVEYKPLNGTTLSKDLSTHIEKSRAVKSAKNISETKSASPGVKAVVIVKIWGRDAFCSGVLIGANVVLTARHCVQDMGQATAIPASNIRIGVGDSLEDPALTWYPINVVTIPEGTAYNAPRNLLGNDAAKLHLFADVNIKPLPIAEKYTIPDQPTGWSLIGFGENRDGYIGRQHRSSISIEEMHRDTFTFTGGGCKGDSGGPILNRDNEIVGIVSLSTSIHCISHAARYGQRI